jgi:8-oxo-dGTP diphosphatase
MFKRYPVTNRHSDLTEAEYLAQYDIHRYPAPLATVDVAIFTWKEDQLQVLLVEREHHPYRGLLALPGGFIELEHDADLTQSALRTLTQKTGVETPTLEQVQSVGSLGRDPRGWSLTVLYMALLPLSLCDAHVQADLGARWVPVSALDQHRLAFDHAQLIHAAKARLTSKTAYTALPIYLLNAPFTLTQLQQVFEGLLGQALEKKSFRRRMLNAELLKEVGEGVPEGGRGRPAALYEPCERTLAHQFVRVLGD